MHEPRRIDDGLFRRLVSRVECRERDQPAAALGAGPSPVDQDPADPGLEAAAGLEAVKPAQYAERPDLLSADLVGLAVASRRRPVWRDP